MGDLERVPLEERKIIWKDEGEEIEIPAIDKRWCTYRPDWGAYYNIEKGSSPMVEETWRQAMERLQDSFDFLLSLDHASFWSQLIFDRDVHGANGFFKSLDLYLTQCPRYTEPELRDYMFFGKAVAPTQKGLYTSCFRILARMATSKENKKDFMGKEYFAEMLHKSKIFTVPRTMDALCLFGTENDMASKLVRHVLKEQPKLLQDFETSFKQLFDILSRCETELLGSAGEEMRVLRRKETEWDRGVIASTISFALDTFQTYTLLMRFVPALLPTLVSSGLVVRLTRFYQRIYSCGRRAASSKTAFAFSNAGPLIGRLEYIEELAVKLVRSVIQDYFLKPLEGKAVPGDKLSSNEERLRAYLAFRKELLPHKDDKFPFVGIYDNMYPFSEDLNSFRSYSVVVPDDEEKELLRSHELAKMRVGFDAWVQLFECGWLNRLPWTEVPAVKRTAIDDALELFPKYSYGFLLTCASNYKYESTAVLDALLTANDLPKPLFYYRFIADKETTPEVTALFRAWASGRKDAEIHASMESFRTRGAACTLPPEAAAAAAVASVPEAVNGAEESMAAASAEEGLMKIDEGKKHGKGRWTDKDRKEVQKMKDFYRKYEEETLGSDEEEGDFGLYDDEYDDTYDGYGDYGDASDYLKKRQIVPTVRELKGFSAGDQQVGASAGGLSGDWGSGNPNRVEFGGEEEEESENAKEEFGGGGRGRGVGTRGRGMARGRGDGRGAVASGGSARGATTYTGGRGRQQKEQRSAHNQKNRARNKYSRGMF